MAGIAGIVRWDGQEVKDSWLEHMVNMIQHRGPDGLSWGVHKSVGFGHAKIALHKREQRANLPFWLQDYSFGITADIRIHNRQEFKDRIGSIPWLRHDPTDAELVLAAYERFGIRLLDYLVGDFAFAIWDGKNRKLFAAKDPFGVKPFFYTADPQRFLFGSESKQLLTLPGVEVAADKLIVGEYIFAKFEEPQRTFFKDISRLKPAHYLLATPDCVVQNRYWQPDPTKEIHLAASQQYFDNFLTTFKQSVFQRLNIDRPTMLELSGGMDSTSIAAIASMLVRDGLLDSSGIETISSIFPGLGCDESQYIKEMIATVPFGSNVIEATRDAKFSNILDDIWHVDSPNINMHIGRSRELAEVINSAGSKVVITGIGGDEVLSDEYYLIDIALRKKFFLLCREVLKYGKKYEYSFLRTFGAVLRQAAPTPLRQAYRSLKTDKSRYVPDWVNPEFGDFFYSCPAAPPSCEISFKSRLQATVFENICAPKLTTGLEFWECQQSYHGWEVSHPFLDREVVECILGIPFIHRIPPNAEWKYLVRRAFGSCLPPQILSRKFKTVFDSYVFTILQNGREKLIELLHTSGDWECSDFIVEKEASKRLANFNNANNPNWLDDARPVWVAATLELWLRGMNKYSSNKFRG